MSDMAERVAAEKVLEELVKPLADANDPQDSDKEFDPWSIFPALYGSYSGEFDHCAIQVLEDVRDGTHNRQDLAAQMFREMLCTGHLCDYGTSPRVCFPTAEFKKVLPDLIEKWKAYYLAYWQSEYDPRHHLRNRAALCIKRTKPVDAMSRREMEM